MSSKPRGPKAQATNPKTIPAKKGVVKAGTAAPKKSVSVPPPAKTKSIPSLGKPAVKRPAKGQTEDAKPVVPESPAPKPAVALTKASKQSQLISKLGTAPGLSIAQMMALTGWQAHTVRGTISGVLRKKLGLNVVSEHPHPGAERLYRIAPAVAA